MNAETVTRIIQVIIAPVVMVTACAILSGGMLSHYADISDRLRAIARERLELVRAGTAPSADPLIAQRLDEFSYQVPELLHRLRMMRDAILAVYGAILIYVLDMFVITLTATTNDPSIATAALVIFLIGTVILLLGVGSGAREIRLSHRAVAHEAERNLAVGK